MNTQIQKIRKSKNMTLADVANRVGVAECTVSLWESGARKPRTEMLPKLAKAFGCTINDLFEEDEE